MDDLTTARIMLTFPAGTTLRGQLTTAHAASSYGLPVIVIGDEAFGPGDIMPEAKLTLLEPTAEAQALLDRFHVHARGGDR